jgi:hypothetical protein
MHLSKHYHGCRCIIRLILQLDITLSALLTCISCFYIYLVKYFNLNEKFILLKNSLDRIGILYRNLDRIRIRQFRIGF